jgi:L-amino acid N-acyltransferase YncA
MNAGSINIRQAVAADAGAIAEVHVAPWRATYSGIVAQSYLEELSIDGRSAQWQRRLADTTASRSAVFVAEEDGAIVGFFAGGPRRVPANCYDAQLHAIYLRSEVQGRGTGRELAKIWAAVAVDRALAAAVV